MAYLARAQIQVMSNNGFHPLTSCVESAEEAGLLVEIAKLMKYVYLPLFGKGICNIFSEKTARPNHCFEKARCYQLNVYRSGKEVTCKKVPLTGAQLSQVWPTRFGTDKCFPDTDIRASCRDFLPLFKVAAPQSTGSFLSQAIGNHMGCGL
jgi:hypothetical protein